MSLDDIATERWRTHTSAEGLTWGMVLDGAALVEAIEKHARLAGVAVLEIGPGYGRLLRSLVDSSVPFASYAALDISEHWVRELTKEFHSHRNISFMCAPVTEANTKFAGRQFDLIVSMLTWKHFHPDFAAAARACRSLLATDGRLIFDLPETDVAWPAPTNVASGTFEETGAFTRTYTRHEVQSLLGEAGLTVVMFDEIAHAPDKRRLLVVARRAAGSS